MTATAGSPHNHFLLFTFKLNKMLPTLLYFLIKKLRKQNWQQVNRNLNTVLFHRPYQFIAALIALLLLLSVVVAAQKQVRNYKVVRNGDEIGWTTVERHTDSTGTTISSGMEVKVRFLLFSFESAAKEISQFRNGTLQHSYYYRKTNGDVKADRHTYLVGSNYEVGNNSQRQKLSISPVAYNTLCMYFQEPIAINKVYSDNHQRFLDITKQADGGYKITSPDNTDNVFYYYKGICYKVKILHSFYSAVLLLK